MSSGRKRFGFHWHFWNFISALAPSAALLLYSSHVRSKHAREKKLPEAEPAKENAVLSPEEATHANKNGRTDFLAEKLEVLESRLQKLEHENDAKNRELMAKRVYLRAKEIGNMVDRGAAAKDAGSSELVKPEKDTTQKKDTENHEEMNK